MSELAAFAYIVVGGLVAGRAFHWQLEQIGADPEIKGPKDIPFTGLLLFTLLVWLAWPVVWGVMRASREER